jgi:hypothetical protein
MKTTKLEKINACKDARGWVATQKNYKEAWMNCERGDWMLWLAKRLRVDDRKLTLAKFKCASQVRHLMKDPRSLAALDAAEKYGNGEISRDELDTAAYAAYAAAAAAAATAAAAYAADAAAYAADAADAATAKKESLKKSADFCREILTEEVLTAYKKLR